jgi:putative transposase
VNEGLIPAAATSLQMTTAVPAPKVALSSEEEEQARARYRIIEPLLQFASVICAPGSSPGKSNRPPEHSSSATGSFGGPSLAESEERQSKDQMHLGLGLVLPDGRQVTTAGHMALYLAHLHGISDRTIRRWHRGFLKQGLVGLADRTRKDKDKSRFFEENEKAAALAAYLYLEQRQSIQAAYEAIRRDCQSLGVELEDTPSYMTVHRFLNGKRFSEPLRLLAREGARVYRERCAPYVSRDYGVTASNEIWVSDHMIHDVEVQNDCFLDQEWGKPIRLRFTCLLDFHSRFVVGCCWCWEGSSHSIASAIRRAVTVYGPAEVFYCDNGKDYLRVAKGAMPAYLRESGVASEDWYSHELAALTETGILARLGMAAQHCIVRHPQSKHVERFFRTVHERFDKKFPTYTGGSPATRPDFTTEAMAKHRKLLRMGQPGMSLHPPASLVIRMALTWIEDYHSTPHRGQGMNGRTPRQAFEQDRNPRQRPTPQPEVLAMMLAERQERAVRECSIELAKKRYIGDDEISATMLHEMNGRKVTVAFDPLDLEKVAVLDQEGRLIAWARQQHYLTQSADPETGAAIAESMQQRRRLEKYTRQAIVGIAATARANGAMTDVEHLAARAGAMGEVVMQRPMMRIRPDDTAVAPPSPEDAARILIADEEDSK